MLYTLSLLLYRLVSTNHCVTATATGTSTLLINSLVIHLKTLVKILYQLWLSDCYKHRSILLTLTHTVTDSCPSADVCVFSSQAEANQYTGMVYQGLLLSDRRRLRTESIEEHATPTSAPAQWPGNKHQITLHGTHGEIESLSSDESFYVERKVTSVKILTLFTFLIKSLVFRLVVKIIFTNNIGTMQTLIHIWLYEVLKVLYWKNFYDVKMDSQIHDG